MSLSQQKILDLSWKKMNFLAFNFKIITIKGQKGKQKKITHAHH